MGRNFTFENDAYSVQFSEDATGIHFSLVFKARPAPRQAVEAGRGARITVPATDHQRRKGVFEDEVMVLSRGDGIFEVESRSEPGSFHTVHMAEDGTEQCGCQAAHYGRLCRHVKAVRILVGRDPNEPLRAPPADLTLRAEILSDQTD